MHQQPTIRGKEGKYYTLSHIKIHSPHDSAHGLLSSHVLALRASYISYEASKTPKIDGHLFCRLVDNMF
jgi:hypothetical protein